MFITQGLESNVFTVLGMAVSPESLKDQIPVLTEPLKNWKNFGGISAPSSGKQGWVE